MGKERSIHTSLPTNLTTFAKPKYVVELRTFAQKTQLGHSFHRQRGSITKTRTRYYPRHAAEEHENVMRNMSWQAKYGKLEDIMLRL